MTHEEKALWQKIEQFRFDEEGNTFTFADRLAKEQNWNDDYTRRVINEYKKFIFLCCVSPTMMSPSNPVDQAWHLHLTYTKSYWDELCKKTIAKELHHHPTKGGAEESKKFKELYAATLQFYEKKFGERAPLGIWQLSQETSPATQKPRAKTSSSSNRASVKKTYQIVLLLIAGFALLLALLADSVLPVIFGAIVMLFAVVIYTALTQNQKNRNHGGNDGSDGGAVLFGGFWSGESSSDSHHGDSSHGSSHDSGHGCSSSDSSSSGGDSSCSSGCGGGCGGD